MLFKRADYNKFIKSTLYSPSSQYNVLTKEHFNEIEPNPLIVSLFPKKDQASSLPVVPCKFGNVPKGSILSYQQKFTEEYVINDFTCTAFPILPLDGAVNRYENNIAICLTANNKQPWTLRRLPSRQLLYFKKEQLHRAKALYGICCERNE